MALKLFDFIFYCFIFKIKTMGKETFKSYSVNDLLTLEKATRTVCMKYESASKNYDGSIINNEQYSLFRKYNDFRGNVVNEIEKRLNEEIDKYNGEV